MTFAQRFSHFFFAWKQDRVCLLINHFSYGIWLWNWCWQLVGVEHEQFSILLEWLQGINYCDEDDTKCYTVMLGKHFINFCYVENLVFQHHSIKVGYTIQVCIYSILLHRRDVVKSFM